MGTQMCVAAVVCGWYEQLLEMSRGFDEEDEENEENTFCIQHAALLTQGMQHGRIREMYAVHKIYSRNVCSALYDIREMYAVHYIVRNVCSALHDSKCVQCTEWYSRNVCSALHENTFCIQHAALLTQGMQHGRIREMDAIH